MRTVKKTATLQKPWLRSMVIDPKQLYVPDFPMRIFLCGILTYCGIELIFTEEIDVSL